MTLTWQILGLVLLLLVTIAGAARNIAIADHQAGQAIVSELQQSKRYF